jgi:two-component system aerobic respiration control protein ArcA
MAKGKRINTRDLVDKIDKLTKERIAKEKVVSLAEFRKLKKKEQPESILLIEDDESVRKALRRLLEDEGYSVVTAVDGTQLAEVLDDNPLDLIILDIGLPWVNGLELARLMKENKDLREIPLIFVSGRTSDIDVKRGFEAGCDDYIKKPFDNEKVKRSVRTLLRLRS